METRLIPVVALATGLVSLMIYLTPPPASAQSAGAGASAGGASAGAGASAGGGSASGGAGVSYRSGNKRAAKELLCEQREAYDAFRRTATPCLARADWELKGTTTQALTSEAPNGFRARDYRTKSDCLTAAYTNHVPLSACNGR